MIDKYQKNELKFHPLQQIETLLLIFFLPCKKIYLYKDIIFFSFLPAKKLLATLETLTELVWHPSKRLEIKKCFVLMCFGIN